MERLVSEWESGAMRFDGPGECLLGAFDGCDLIGIGGISRDPYLSAPNIGRLRHLYVRKAARRRGVGSALVDQLLAKGRAVFDDVRLRTDCAEAARFYLRKGFVPIDDPSASHRLAI